jgi:hypothetical protein
MRTAVRMIVGAGCLIGLLVACVGGPGSVSTTNGGSGQNGAVERDPSNNDNPGSSSGSTGAALPVNNQQISAASYDRGCSTDEDCVAVYQGAVCQLCKCPSEPIAKKDKDKYDRDLEQKRVGCPAQTGESCQPCATPQVGCNPTTKQCGVNVTSNDAGP